MPDPKRIPGVLRRLEKVWRENPDLRLGQMVVNAPYYVSGTADAFYIPDDQLIDAIERVHASPAPPRAPTERET